MKSSTYPKVTILLATFNRAHLILETLESIKNQTYTNFECLITDDNSTDDTEVIVKAFRETDSRFYYFKKPKKYLQGLSATRNFGLDLAEERNAEYIQFFDDDDIMHPRKLELQIGPLIENSNLDFTICQYKKFRFVSEVNFDIKKIESKYCNIQSKNLLKSFYLNITDLNSLGPIFRFSKIRDYRFSENLYYAEEREFFLRILLNEKLKHKGVQQVLFWYRKHNMSITSNLYDNVQIKPLSEKLADKLFFNEVLNNESAPSYILKSFIAKSYKQKEKFYRIEIKKYLFSNFRYLNLKYYQLLLFYFYKRLKNNI